MNIHQRGEVSEEEIEESFLGISGWAFARVRDQPSIDIGESMALGDRAVGNCTATDPEPRHSVTSNAVDAMRQSRSRRMAFDSLGVQTVQLLDAIGALDSVIGALDSVTDDDEGDILGVDSWADSEIDSGCCERVMDLGTPRAMARS